MIRILSSMAFLLLGTVLSAVAGDFSEFRPVGFSVDGKVFVFEEFGIQDGSGFAYANRFYIDTTRDVYLPGSPVRVLVETDGAGVAEAREQAYTKAKSLEQAHQPAANPGIFSAFAPATETGEAGALAMTYRSFAIEPFSGGAYSVELVEKTLPVSPDCEGITPNGEGFTLTMTARNGASESLILHDDAAVPASRKCPISYRLGGALTHRNPDGTTTHAILVLMRAYGFEGPNGRWLAVTARLD